MASLIDSANCLAAWLFDGEITGGVAIDYKAAYNLIDGGVPVQRASSHAGYGTGVYANFLGPASDMRLIGAGPNLASYPNFSICLWVYVNETAMPSTNPVFFCNESSNSPRSMRIYFDAATSRFTVAIAYAGGTVATKTGPSAPTVKVWYWLCAVVKDSALYFYQNNVMSGLQTALIMPVDDAGFEWAIGQLNDGGSTVARHKGRIDEVAVFDKALTATERALIYASGLGADNTTLERALHNNATSIVNLLDPACESLNLLAPVLSIEEPLDTEICMP